MPISAQISARRDEILALARRHGATNVRLFGSVSRGDDRIDSDVDVLVSLSPGSTLLDHVALQQDLEELLGRPVDVVVETGLSPHLRDHILAEATAL